MTKHTVLRHSLSLIATALAAFALAACGDKDAVAKPGQALASVNGEEITTMQLNEELQRANITPAQQEAASKQLLRVLVDRQLLQNEAAKEKIERDPKVMLAIERAKAMIVAQAYMQKKVGVPARPTPAEIADYFSQHPEFFARRKQFVLHQLMLATRDLTPQVQAAAGASKSLEEMAAHLDASKIKYTRNQVTRSSSDLAPELSNKLLTMPKGQLFAVREGERSLLIGIGEIKDAPVTLETASRQIEQFLVNKRNKDAAEAELARLRATARIEYMNKSLAPDAKAAPATVSAVLPAAAPAEVDSTAANDSADKAALERGVAGLK
jgi:peptidyl-prolyl cis-trans isomerase C